MYPHTKNAVIMLILLVDNRPHFCKEVWIICHLLLSFSSHHLVHTLLEGILLELLIAVIIRANIVFTIVL